MWLAKVNKLSTQEGIRWMRVCHGVTATFDDPNLVSCAGLAPVLEMAERAGLQDLVVEHVRIGKPGGVNACLKVLALVAGMIAGADSIEDMGLLRHGGMRRLFTGVRAPSTLGTFLRMFTFGHVRQLDAVASRLLIDQRARPARPVCPSTRAALTSRGSRCPLRSEPRQEGRSARTSCYSCLSRSQGVNG